MQLRYRTLNVFTTAGDRLSGNPLCVVEDGSGLEGAQMQALARRTTPDIREDPSPSTSRRARIERQAWPD